MIPFSLVTTCRNEMRSFPRWKENMKAQTRFPDEIVIVDAFSDDGTWEAILQWSKEDSRVRGIQEKGAAAHGRNVAIENATYEHIVSTDMGVRHENVFCEELMKPFEEDGTIQQVMGATCIDVDTVKTLSAKAEWYIEEGGVSHPGPGQVGGNRTSAFLKKIWEEQGGLPEDLTFYGDDSTLYRQYNQAGYKQAYVRKPLTHWGRHKRLSQYWHEAFVYGRGDGEAAIKMSKVFGWYIQKKMPWCIVPFLSGMRVLVKQFKIKNILKCFFKGDFLVPFVMPVFSFGIGWNQIKGYKVGYENGWHKCVLCRTRLIESSNNLAKDRRYKK